MRECVRACLRDSGQTVVEWLAVMAGVVTLAGAATVAMPGVAPAITGGMQAVICDVVGGSCGAPPAPTAPRAQLPATPPAATPTPANPPAATPAPADPPATTAPPEQDLCGSSYFNVPELWFTPACAAHDRCYGAHQGKAACDTAFLHDMLDICAKLPSSSGGVNSSFTRASCRAAAHLYYKGVVIGGGFSYCHRPVCRKDE
jgi:hypothetical protein